VLHQWPSLNSSSSSQLALLSLRVHPGSRAAVVASELVVSGSTADEDRGEYFLDTEVEAEVGIGADL